MVQLKPGKMWSLLLQVIIIGSIFAVPWTIVEKSEAMEEGAGLLAEVEGKYVVAVDQENINIWSLYAVGAYKYGLSSPCGSLRESVSREALDACAKIEDSFRDGKCEMFKTSLEKSGARTVIGIGRDCETLEACGLNKEAGDTACLFTLA